MTEKRFIDGGEECIEDQFLIDTSNDKYYFIDNGLDDIIDLMNEQHEMIIKLQKENEELLRLIKSELLADLLSKFTINLANAMSECFYRGKE